MATDRHTPRSFSLKCRVQETVLILVYSGSDARSRERPMYCDPPTVTAVAPGQIFAGKVMQGAVGLLLLALVLSAVFDFADKPRVM